MRYKVVRSYTETQFVEARNHADAIEKANDYPNRNKWEESNMKYQVDEA